jgi:hypothetical protein
MFWGVKSAASLALMAASRSACSRALRAASSSVAASSLTMADLSAQPPNMVKQNAKIRNIPITVKYFFMILSFQGLKKSKFNLLL